MLFVSCTEEYQLHDIENLTTIVVEGSITNIPGPYFIRISESTSNVLTGETTQRGINDARVVITDEKGNKDELQPLSDLKVDSVYTKGFTESGHYAYFINIPDYTSGFISFSLGNVSWRYPHYDMPQGYYYTTKIEGIPGNTYTLEVTYNGQTYTATDKMPHGTVLDSISLEPVGKTVYDKPDGDEGFDVPCLYFSEPQDEVNFYMFNYLFSQNLYNIYDDIDLLPYPPYNILNFPFNFQHVAPPYWSFSVLSDRFLPSKIEKYKLSQGDDATYTTGTDHYFQNRDLHNFTVIMWNISEATYLYYFTLSQHYLDDGGSFKPAPAAPPTNLSNGAQGFFFASSVSYYMLKNDAQK
jgi:hypothetical protein